MKFLRRIDHQRGALVTQFVHCDDCTYHVDSNRITETDGHSLAPCAMRFSRTSDETHRRDPDDDDDQNDDG
ncbi:unnamed protein product [Haemonchus placei]|uniref:Transcriptional regulator n=1 Tax=Haemonchus placei TaxID=6290 RepID=A0A0N4X090_HAEPC|nr:unnamed protein product [Haemonchus placei]